jgi:recombination protein RecT
MLDHEEQPESTAVEVRKPATLRTWLQDERFKGEIAKAVPKHVSSDRILRIALTALTRTPKLQECEQGSFLQCLLDLASWGLEPNGRDAHLIPFKNNKRNTIECQLILDYKGLVQLLYRSDRVLSIHADLVFEGDVFEYNKGQVLKHQPWFLRKDSAKPEEQGKIVAVYCEVQLKGGSKPKCELMSKREIDAVRARSKAKSSGPWVTDYGEMAKKTAFRRCSKWLPISAEMKDALDRDFDAPDFAAAVTVNPAPPMPTLDQLAAGKAPEAAAELEQIAPPEEQPNYQARVASAVQMDELQTIIDEAQEDSSLNDQQFANVMDACDARSETLLAAQIAAKARETTDEQNG